jgi:hypothetical protein
MTLTHLNFLLGHPVHKSLTDINYEICVTVTIGIIKKIIINAFTNFFLFDTQNLRIFSCVNGF